MMNTSWKKLPGVCRAWWMLGLLCFVGCAYEEVRTQVTLRIYASAEVKQQLQSLRVHVYADREPADEKPKVVYPASTIARWPVDVQVAPRPERNEYADAFEVVVEALDAAGVPLVQTRRRTAYVPLEKRVLELWLEPCGSRPLGVLCEPNPSCRGATCLTCVEGACAPTPFESPHEALDPLATLDPEKASPSNLPGDPTGFIDAGDMLDAGEPQQDADVSDAGVRPSDGGCTDSWTTVRAFGRIPKDAPSFADLVIQGEGRRLQYICRARTPEASNAPGKVNAFPDAGTIDYGCYYGFYDSAMERWVGLGADHEGETFELFTPPPRCKFEWVATRQGQAAPPGVVLMTLDKRSFPVYSCRVDVNDMQTKGTHIGRVTGGATLDRCVVQYFGDRPMLWDQFQILTEKK